MGVSGNTTTPAALLAGKRPATPCIGDWQGQSGHMHVYCMNLKVAMTIHHPRTTGTGV